MALKFESLMFLCESPVITIKRGHVKANLFLDSLLIEILMARRVQKVVTIS